MSPARALPAALILLAAFSALPVPLPPPPASAQEAEAPEGPPPTLPTGMALLRFEGQEVPIGYSLSPAGPLFALPPLVARLGGQLAVGPLGQSHVLELPALRAVLGPASPAATVGQDIVVLSHRPVLGPDGLHVPLDFLERTFGSELGYVFQWDPGAQALAVTRTPRRELPVSVDLVHLQGVSTVVLQFPAPPRYRIARRPGRLVVEMVGDVLRTAEPLALPQDPLVERVTIRPDRIEIALAPESAADDYVLRDPFRLVFDVHRTEPAVADAPEVRPPAPVPGVQTIVIDPGHGGGETGAIGRSGVAEKELTLLVAQTLKRLLEARLPVRVVLTRSEDADLPLDTRTALANQHKADLFISLHLNSALGPNARGAETYFLSLQASDQRAAQSAEAENRAGGDGADPLYELQLILWDLAQSRHLAESQRLANLIQEELNQALELRDRGVKQAPFRVLMGAAMPAVLVELGFLSNPDEEARLQDPGYRAQLAEALVRAVMRYEAQAQTARVVEAGEPLP